MPAPRIRGQRPIRSLVSRIDAARFFFFSLLLLFLCIGLAVDPSASPSRRGSASVFDAPARAGSEAI